MGFLLLLARESGVLHHQPATIHNKSAFFRQVGIYEGARLCLVCPCPHGPHICGPYSKTVNGDGSVGDAYMRPDIL